MSIEFKEVSHIYPDVKKNDLTPAALNNVSISIDSKDEFVMIVGRTGSGKSTMIQHMNGLLLPTTGSVSIDEFTLTSKKRKNPKLKPIRKKVGYVFQFPEYQLFEETVYKDIIFGPKNFGLDDATIKKNVDYVVERLGISKLLKKSPFELSGGQMRKVAIAGILACDPDILILDEPTRGLDPLGAKEIMAFFKELQEKEHKTIIMITHDMDLVYEFATRVVVLQKGELVFDGDKETLFKEEYARYALDKPTILKAIDYINENTNHKLSYNHYTLNDLLAALKEGEPNE